MARVRMGGTTMEGMADIEPAFKKDGVIRAGNSSPLNVATADMILMSKETVRKKGIHPLATVRSIGLAGVDPTIVGQGPVPASRMALEKAGLKAARRVSYLLWAGIKTGFGFLGTGTRVQQKREPIIMKTSGKTILITGGTSGIGRGLAEAFYRLNNKVIICGRRAERLRAIEKQYTGIVARACDVTDSGQREELATWIRTHHPETDILINNAGIQLPADLKNIDLERLRLELETNLVAPIQLCSLFAPHLISRSDAAIINISSGLAFVPIAFMPIYCATKAALHSFTMSLRHQLQQTAVKVFEIIPPSVDTELGHERRRDKTQTHGGMPVREFIEQAMAAIKADTFEAAIGGAEKLREKRDSLFPVMNRQHQHRDQMDGR